MARIVTAKAITANPIRNDGATVLWGNHTSNRTVTQSLGRTTVGANRGPAFTNAIPTASTSAEQASRLYYRNVTKGLSNGNYGVLVARKFIITRVTRDISGIANLSKLVFGHWATPRIAINKKENSYVRQVRAVTYSYVTGQPTTFPVVTNDSFGTDLAARPTRSAPGRITITTGSKVHDPATSNYRAET
jgi:hypothetical protein